MLAFAATVVLAAAAPGDRLGPARALIERLEFAAALQWLEGARQLAGDDAVAMRSILEWTAYCQVAEGLREDATKTFIALLELDAGAALSPEVASPKVAEVFQQARRRHFPRDAVTLSLGTPAAGRARLGLLDPWGRVARVVLHRRLDGGEWTQRALEVSAGELSFPLQLDGGSLLEWFVEALGTDAAVLASLGTRAAPRQYRQPSLAPGPGALSVVPGVPSAGPPPGGSVRPGRVVGLAGLGLGLALTAVATGLQVDAWNRRLAARDRTSPPGDYAATALETERGALSQQGWAIGLFTAGGLALGTGLALAW